MSAGSQKLQSWSTMQRDLRLFMKAHLTQKYLQPSLLHKHAWGSGVLINVLNFKDFLKHINYLLPELNELSWTMECYL